MEKADRLDFDVEIEGIIRVKLRIQWVNWVLVLAELTTWIIQNQRGVLEVLLFQEVDCERVSFPYFALHTILVKTKFHRRIRKHNAPWEFGWVKFCERIRVEQESKAIFDVFTSWVFNDTLRKGVQRPFADVEVKRVRCCNLWEEACFVHCTYSWFEHYWNHAAHLCCLI